MQYTILYSLYVLYGYYTIRMYFIHILFLYVYLYAYSYACIYPKHILHSHVYTVPYTILRIYRSQNNFVLSDPSLPDNPIVYCSEGFCKLTGYKRQFVLGRNCRFLQVYSVVSIQCLLVYVCGVCIGVLAVYCSLMYIYAKCTCIWYECVYLSRIHNLLCLYNTNYTILYTTLYRVPVPIKTQST